MRSPSATHDAILARRIGVSVDELSDRRILITQAIHASHQELNALSMMFTDLCAAYQDMGEKLKMFSELVSRQETVAGLDEVYTKLSKEGQPVASKLLELYVLIPRPTVQLLQTPAPAPTSSDSP